MRQGPGVKPARVHWSGLPPTAADAGSVVQERVPLRPPLKWAGGKRWQLRHLRPIWTAHEPRRLVEPFCGGLSVALGLCPRRALLNDANPHLVNFYRWLQQGLRVDLR